MSPLIPFAWDTETELVRPGKKAGGLSCLTHAAPSTDPGIVDRFNAHDLMREKLSRSDVLFIGHFVAYDFSVLCAEFPDLIPDVFRAYEEDRVTDTMLREQLLDIAAGKFKGYADSRGVWRRHDYSLDAVARRRAGVALKKDGWRLRYGEFRDLPLHEWPAKADAIKVDAQRQVDAGADDKDLLAIAAGPASDVFDYPLQDARSTLQVWCAQEDVAGTLLEDQYRRARASWWLTLASVWGLRTDPSGAETLAAVTQQEVAELEGRLQLAGLVRKNGSRDTKAATALMLRACELKGISPRLTAAGGVCLDRDACKATDDETLADYGELAQKKAVLSKDVPMIRAGAYWPIHTRWGIAETGRATSSSPNIMNMRRVAGIREAFVPRKGFVFAQADYPGLELRTLAQTCVTLFGMSALADMLNEGKDPHMAFAATLLGLTYDEATTRKKEDQIKDARQVGKVFNFGSPGGLGAEKLCLFARKTYGVHIDPADAKKWKKTWFATFPEMRLYFDHVNTLTEAGRPLVQLFSGRVRGGATYTAACNDAFQGLGATATQHAGFFVSRACYVDRESPLFGSRVVNYVHDEFIVETPDNDNAHDAATELSAIMIERANVFLPDVPFSEVEPLLMRRWSKDAAPILDASGRLVPWDVAA